MCISHPGDVVHKRVSNLSVVEEAVRILFIHEMLFPGAEMHFIDRHRSLYNGTVVTLLLVDFIMPDVPVKRTDDGRIGRALLRAEAIRVGFVAENSVRSVYHKTVHMAVLHTRDKTRPNRVILLCALHGAEIVPPGDLVDHRNIFGVRSPDTKPRTLYAVFLRRMRTEVFIGLIIRAQMEWGQRKVYFFLCDWQIRYFFHD